MALISQSLIAFGPLADPTGFVDLLQCNMSVWHTSDNGQLDEVDMQKMHTNIIQQYQCAGGYLSGYFDHFLVKMPKIKT